MFARFANFACSFAFLLGVKPLWSVFFHFARCFPVSSVIPVSSRFSILLGVFSFGWGSQNYEQKVVFITTMNIFAWSNQNPKPKYTFRSFYATEYPSPQKTENPIDALTTKLQLCLAQPKQP
jgi:hypothetical protein